MEENVILWTRKAKSYRLLDICNQENIFSLYACPSLLLFCGQLVMVLVGDRTLHFAHWLHAATPTPSISLHPWHSVPRSLT